MLEIRLRFTREIWDELLSMLDQDPATKVYLNFEQGVMSTTFLFYNDIDEKEWSGYITGLNTIKKTAPTDEGNMFAFKLNDYHLFEIRQVLEDDYEPILKYEHLTRKQVADLHARCMRGFYFRSRYFADNAQLLWPSLQRFVKSRSAATGSSVTDRPVRRAA